jgi:NADH dehydrogenase FAD-containing subunit
MTAKHVVVVGAGYAGLSVCKALVKDKTIKITLVDMREGFMLHKWAALRSATFGGDWIDKAFVPSDKLSNVTFVQGRLLKV